MTATTVPGYSCEVAFEPGDGLGVEVVRRLVEQEDVGAFQEDLAEGDPALLAAGEGRDVGVAGREPHGVHGDLDVAVEVPGVGGVDGVLDLGLLVEELLHLVGVERLAEPGVDLVEPGEQGPGLGDGQLDVAPDVERGVEHRLLRDEADGGPGGGLGGADEVLVDARP